MTDDVAGPRQAGVSLLFARGSRPDADAVAALAGGGGEVVSFAISHRPSVHPFWLELLALGLTFDLQGLAPGIPAKLAAPAHAFAIQLGDTRGLEGLTLRPGPHLVSGSTLLPVIRAMAALGCELARLPGLVAIGWEPARTAMTPDYYTRVVGAWLKGGAFPGLGMTALVRARDGTVRSDGLAFFAGFEVAVCPIAGEAPADLAKLTLRVIHDLVENGPYSAGLVEGPGGVPLHCEFTANGAQLRISRDTSAPA